MIAVGYNYISHREEMTHEEPRPIPEHPPLFLKLPTSLTGPETDVVYPPDATDLHFEGELVVVIGKTDEQDFSRAGARPYLRRHRGQRRQRTQLAGQRPAVVACQGERHIRPARPCRRRPD